MTWIIGGNCFNGFVCVADIQATIEFKDGRPNEYYNCVRKVHKVFDNLCIAFSGDIRSGLLIIEKLSIDIPKTINENEYFDIDGQSAMLIEYLRNLYAEINSNNQPHLELMFLWVAQEGDGLIFRPFCMTFKSPDFRMNSTPIANLAQSGSGKNNKTFNAIADFLSGKQSNHSEYSRLFSSFESPSNIITVRKFKQILFHEASKVTYPGVSKNLTSFECEINYQGIYPDWIRPILRQAFIDMGVEFINRKTANHEADVFGVDLKIISERIISLEKDHPEKFEEIRKVITAARELENHASICVIPPIVEDKHYVEDELRHSPTLISKWGDMVSFLKKKNISIKACNALA